MSPKSRPSGDRSLTSNLQLLSLSSPQPVNHEPTPQPKNKPNTMANVSDGEDSQMHDSPSSTPSTPPATLSNPAERLSLHSPPVEKTPPATQQSAPVPAWATKRAQEEAEAAKEKVVDVKFSLKWLEDDLDESDMWK